MTTPSQTTQHCRVKKSMFHCPEQGYPVSRGRRNEKPANEAFTGFVRQVD